MRRTIRTARAAAAIVIASVPALTGGLGVGVAAAQDGPTVLSFGQTLRRCDFSGISNVGGTGYARPTALMRAEGGQVVADVQIATALPNTRYEARLIQAPRSSAVSCNPGDPGVAGAALFTDAVGAGALTLRGPIMSGATGAWVFITRPSPYSQVPEEFYATDFIAKL